MPKRQQSSHRRNIYVAALNKSFSGQEGIAIRDDFGGFYVVLGVSGLLHLKKVDRKTLLAWIPQALQQDTHPQQLPLGELINEQNVPLNQLHCLVIGFVENKLGDLEAVYIIEQNGDAIDYRLPLEITATIPFTVPASDEADIPFPKFNAKKKDDKTTGAS
jgi:hypothetical protein